MYFLDYLKLLSIRAEPAESIYQAYNNWYANIQSSFLKWRDLRLLGRRDQQEFNKLIDQIIEIIEIINGNIDIHSSLRIQILTELDVKLVDLWKEIKDYSPNIEVAIHKAIKNELEHIVLPIEEAYSNNFETYYLQGSFREYLCGEHMPAWQLSIVLIEKSCFGMAYKLVLWLLKTKLLQGDYFNDIYVNKSFYGVDRVLIQLIINTPSDTEKLALLKTFIQANSEEWLGCVFSSASEQDRLNRPDTDYIDCDQMNIIMTTYSKLFASLRDLKLFDADDIFSKLVNIFNNLCNIYQKAELKDFDDIDNLLDYINTSTEILEDKKQAELSLQELHALFQEKLRKKAGLYELLEFIISAANIIPPDIAPYLDFYHPLYQKLFSAQTVEQLHRFRTMQCTSMPLLVLAQLNNTILLYKDILSDLLLNKRSDILYQKNEKERNFVTDLIEALNFFAGHLNECIVFQDEDEHEFVKFMTILAEENEKNDNPTAPNPLSDTDYIKAEMLLVNLYQLKFHLISSWEIASIDASMHPPTSLKIIRLADNSNQHSPASEKLKDQIELQPKTAEAYKRKNMFADKVRRKKMQVKFLSAVRMRNSGGTSD